LAKEDDIPEAIVGLNGLAELYLEQANFEEAESFLQRALSICRHRPEVGLIVLSRVLQNLARACRGQGKDAQAAMFWWRVSIIKEAIAELVQSE
jgi:hypothetical protein